MKSINLFERRAHVGRDALLHPFPRYPSAGPATQRTLHRADGSWTSRMCHEHESCPIPGLVSCHPVLNQCQPRAWVMPSSSQCQPWAGRASRPICVEMILSSRLSSMSVRVHPASLAIPGKGPSSTQSSPGGSRGSSTHSWSSLS